MRISFSFIILLILPTLVQSFWYNVAPNGHTLIKVILGQYVEQGHTMITTFPYSDAIAIKFVEDIDTKENLACTSIEGISISYKEIQIGNEINESKVLSTVRRFGLNYDKTKITDVIEKFLQEICRKYTYTDLEIAKTFEVQTLLRDKLQNEHIKLDTGVNITFIRMSNANIPKTLQEERQRLNEETSKQHREKAETETQRLHMIKLAQAQTADNERNLNATNAQIEQERMQSTWDNEKKLEDARAEAQRISIISAAQSAENILKEAHIRNLYGIKEYAIKEQLLAIFKNASTVYIGGDNNPMKMIELVAPHFNN